MTALILPGLPAAPRDKLFTQFTMLANGKPNDAVIEACACVLLSVIHNAKPTRVQAETWYNELSGKMKEQLLKQYDSVSGKRLADVRKQPNLHTKL